MSKLIHFVHDETGATAIEYALIAAALGLVLVAALPTIGAAITSKFSSLAGHVSTGK